MRIVDVTAQTEKSIVTGMIISTEYLKKVMPVFEYEYLDTEGCGLVAKWVVEYFTRWGEAPGDKIGAIFLEKARGLDDPMREWVSELLDRLSKDYVTKGINVDYLFESSVHYFKRQRLRKVTERIIRLLEQDKVDEAEQQWLGMMGMPTEVDLGINPFDPVVAMELLNQQYRPSLTFGIPAFDRLAGPSLSEWLVMFMGPMKRGKTMMLNHIALRSAMSGYNTVMVSLESGYRDLGPRLWMMFGSLTGGNNKNGKIRFPYFSKRAGDDVRYKEAKRPVVNEETVSKALDVFNRYAPGQIRMRSFPSYSAGADDIRLYLDSLEVFEGFHPHVVLVDYLGAMKAPGRLQGRDVYDVNSKHLKAIAEERKVIMFSAHQGSRATLEKLNMHPMDIPEDVRILGNVDALYGLNQTDWEKEQGVMRLNVLIHRWRDWNRLKQVKVLQQLAAGQFYLDARLVDAPKGRDLKRARRNDDGEEDEEE